MDLLALRTFVRSQADIEDDTDFTDAKLNVLIQVGYDTINAAQDWPYLETQSDLTLASGAVTVPTNYSTHREDLKYILSSSSIRSLTELDWDDIPTNPTSLGEPRYYWIKDGTITVWPAPADGQQVRLRYLKTATALTADAHVPIFDSRFHWVIGQWALVKVYERLDILDQAGVARQEYEEALQRMDAFYLRLRRRLVYGKREKSQVFDRLFANDPFPFEVD